MLETEDIVESVGDDGDGNGDGDGNEDCRQDNVVDVV